MKINKKINLFMSALVLMFMACEPNVDELDLKNTTDVAGVELVATASTPGGNEITLQMVTPGITGWWDYNLGTALTDKVTIVYPIPGTATFTYTGTLGKEFFTKTVDIQIDQLDHALDQDWYDLVSENTAAGKTWVYDGGPAPDGRFWWFMSDPNNNPWGVWWNAAGDCCPPSDAAGKMHFDLDGAANFTYYSGPSASPEAGTFVLDVKNQKLMVMGANILGATNPDEGGYYPSGIYNIVELTEDKMVLYVPDGYWATGWTWVFRPE